MKHAVKQIIKSTIGAATYNALPRKEKRSIVHSIERNLTSEAKAETVNHIKAINEHMGVETKPSKTATVPAVVAVIKDGGANSKSALRRFDEALANLIDPELVEVDTELVMD